MSPISRNWCHLSNYEPSYSLTISPQKVFLFYYKITTMLVCTVFGIKIYLIAGQQSGRGNWVISPLPLSKKFDKTFWLLGQNYLVVRSKLFGC